MITHQPFAFYDGYLLIARGSTLLFCDCRGELTCERIQSIGIQPDRSWRCVTVGEVDGPIALIDNGPERQQIIFLSIDNTYKCTSKSLVPIYPTPTSITFAYDALWVICKDDMLRENICLISSSCERQCVNSEMSYSQKLPLNGGTYIFRHHGRLVLYDTILRHMALLSEQLDVLQLRILPDVGEEYVGVTYDGGVAFCLAEEDRITFYELDCDLNYHPIYAVENPVNTLYSGFARVSPEQFLLLANDTVHVASLVKGGRSFHIDFTTWGLCDIVEDVIDEEPSD